MTLTSPGRTRDALRQSVEAARKVHLTVLVISAALLLVSVSPNRAARYAHFAERLETLPELPFRQAEMIRQIERGYDDLLEQLADTVEAYLPLELRAGRAGELRAPGPGLGADGRARFYAWIDGQSGAPLGQGLADALLELTVGDAPGFLRRVSERFPPQPDPARLAQLLHDAGFQPCDDCDLLRHLHIGAPRPEAPSGVLEVQWELWEGGEVRVVEISTADVLSPRLRDLGWHLSELFFESGAFHAHVIDLMDPRLFEVPDPEVPLPARRPTALQVLEDLRAEDPEIWEEMAVVPLREAATRARERSRAERETLSLLGFSLDERTAVFGGPLILLLALGLLAAHLGHVRDTAGDQPLVGEFPWPPLFSGRVGVVAAAGLVFGVPALAVTAFLTRITSHYIGGYRTEIELLATATVLSLACVAASAAAWYLTIRLRGDRWSGSRLRAHCVRIRTAFRKSASRTCR